MIVPLPTDILHVPIADIDELSKSFRSCCRVLGWHTLREVCAMGAIEISKPRHLGPSHFGELVDLLRDREILHVLAD